MRVNLRLFAAAREAARQEVIQVELSEPATVGELRRALELQFPAVYQTARHSLFAVNNEYADDSAIIPRDTEVACIPPVSGG